MNFKSDKHMRQHNCHCFCFLGALLCLFALASGCGKKEDSGDGSGWQKALPSQLASLTIQEGGKCVLDTVNGALAKADPVPVKAGTPTSFVGWAVADVQAGRLGSSLAIQLSGATPYYAIAQAYPRPGLGAALGNVALDGGGLKLDNIQLTLPLGDYHVFFLVQSDSTLLRCDTGHVIRVE